MGTYRVTLEAYTHTGRPLTTEQIEVSDVNRPSTAFIRARQKFFARTALVSGVRVEIRQIEREHNGDYFPLIVAHEVEPGTWVRVREQWRCVAHWEPQGNGTCRLYTGGPATLYPRDEGVYARDDIFETR